MSEKKITSEELAQLIEDYDAERPTCVLYAKVLRRVLERACAVSIPEAAVQVRAKTTSSFAGKCVRKFGKYEDCLKDMTDLCGARVIVQTLEQVEAAKRFVQANFVVTEQDEKGLSLGEERFGYRDLHFIVRLDPMRSELLGITSEEIETIGPRRAEIQVRTWLQHAWADAMHDRIYKAPLRPSPGVRRAGNLLAALMEEGDRNFDALVDELDGMIANYAAFAPRADVEKEIAAQRLILDHEPEPSKRSALALRLGRLLAAYGDYEGVVSVLDPYAGTEGPTRGELLQDLGYALCRFHRKEPDSDGYRRGLERLEEAVTVCGAGQGAYVMHLRKHEGLVARSLARLAWALEPLRTEKALARTLHARAHEHEPGNPYFLTDMVGFEFNFTHARKLSGALRVRLREAAATCRIHSEHGIELPRAYFTAGRLHLLLDADPAVKDMSPFRPDARDALAFYARGIRYWLEGTYCVPKDALRTEREWIEGLHEGEDPPDSQRWVLLLLELAERIGVRRGEIDQSAVVPEALIIAGGAAGMSDEMLEQCRPLLQSALMVYNHACVGSGRPGRVVSGGTPVGVPGLVGEAAEWIGAREERHFETVGYIPRSLPHDARKDERYDRIEVRGEVGFTPEQVLESWRDLLDAGVSPGEVICLGFGGGPLSAVDYRVALALGAEVWVALGSGGAADTLAADPLWAGTADLLPVPMDRAAYRALAALPSRVMNDDTVLAMARKVHEQYVANNARRLPENMRPWDNLDETFRNANREQACHAVAILKTEGFVIEAAADPEEPDIFDEFRTEEIERMAELEHGRWVAERMRSGWRFGRVRDDARKIHPMLVGWNDLPDDVREYDRDAVRDFPEILAVAGLEVRRKINKRESP